MERGLVAAPRLAALAMVAVLSAGCTVSRVDSTAAVTITGTLLAPDGSPQPDTAIVLVKETELSDALLGLALIAGSLGTVCLLDPPPALCRAARRATTGPDGRYSFELAGRDVRSTLGSASTFHLSARRGTGGPLVTSRLRVQTERLEVPELRFWEPKVTLTIPAAGSLRVIWDRYPAGDTESQRAVFLAGPSQDLIWAADGSSPRNVDVRVLEDSQALAAVEAATSVKGEGTTFRITHRSGPVPYQGTAGRPPSRGPSCDGASPCAFTDGDLSPAEPVAAGEAVHAVTIELATLRPIDVVVVRGCPATCEVDLSADGQAWTAAGMADDPFAVVNAPARSSARFVRIRSEADLSRLAELSVW